jgi:serralysin
MGEYQVSVEPYVLPPVATMVQIADQLVSGYWEGDSHHFNVTQGRSLTVNISVLNSTEQALARAALAAWADIIGIHFQEVSGEAQINFSHDEGDDGGPFAATFPVWADGIMSSADINISTSWLTAYGSTLNSYGFETYVHEVGHALGLGHAGNYNFDARYPYDALFRNDATPLSVMSYFDQQQNTYFNFSRGGYDVTPMAADILAMQLLYGLSTTTRTGDTVYGYNSTAGSQYNPAVNSGVAYTIFDNGGRDALDFSGTAIAQAINLNAETFSQVVGGNNNLYIARGIVIENAIGGAGADTIIQNAADNVLNGGPGQDLVSYETATAAVRVNLSFTAQQDTLGAGLDTLNGFEELNGSRFDDRLAGSASSVWVRGGDGNDIIISNSVAGDIRQQAFEGNAGDDTFIPGPGSDRFFGGDGFDTVDYSNATGPIAISSDTSASGYDDLVGIDVSLDPHSTTTS